MFRGPHDADCGERLVVRRPLVIVGQVSPVLRAALRTCAEQLDLRDVRRAGWDLIRLAHASGASAVITSRADVGVVLEGRLPDDILVIGISAAAWDVTVATGSRVLHVANPLAETIVRMILNGPPSSEAPATG